MTDLERQILAQAEKVTAVRLPEAQDYAQVAATATWAEPPPANKYHNEPTVLDGVRFDSKREANRWGELQILLKAGHITRLQRQVRYPLVVNGVLVCTYVADFVYEDVAAGRLVVEDAKGMRTREYKIKAKLMLAVHELEVKEV